MRDYERDERGRFASTGGESDTPRVDRAMASLNEKGGLNSEQALSDMKTWRAEIAAKARRERTVALRAVGHIKSPMPSAKRIGRLRTVASIRKVGRALKRFGREQVEDMRDIFHEMGQMGANFISGR